MQILQELRDTTQSIWNLTVLSDVQALNLATQLRAARNHIRHTLCNSELFLPIIRETFSMEAHPVDDLFEISMEEIEPVYFLKTLLNLLWEAEHCFVDIEALEVSLLAVMPRYLALRDRACTLVFSLLDLGVASHHVFAAEIVLLQQALGVLSTLPMPAVPKDAQAYQLGLTLGAGIQFLKPAQAYHEQDVVAHLTVFLAETLHYWTAFLKQMMNEPPSPESLATIHAEQIKMCERLERMRQRSCYHPAQWVDEINLLLSMLKLTGSLITHSQEAVKRSSRTMTQMLRQLKEQLLPSLFSSLDHVEEVCCFNPGVLSLRIKPYIEALYQVLVKIVQNTITLPNEQENLLCLEDRHFIQWRLLPLKKREQAFLHEQFRLPIVVNHWIREVMMTCTQQGSCMQRWPEEQRERIRFNYLAQEIVRHEWQYSVHETWLQALQHPSVQDHWELIDEVITRVRRLLTHHQAMFDGHLQALRAIDQLVYERANLVVFPDALTVHAREALDEPVVVHRPWMALVSHRLHCDQLDAARGACEQLQAVLMQNFRAQGVLRFHDHFIQRRCIHHYAQLQPYLMTINTEEVIAFDRAMCYLLNGSFQDYLCYLHVLPLEQVQAQRQLISCYVWDEDQLSYIDQEHIVHTVMLTDPVRFAAFVRNTLQDGAGDQCSFYLSGQQIYTQITLKSGHSPLHDDLSVQDVHDVLAMIQRTIQAPALSEFAYDESMATQAIVQEIENHGSPSCMAIIPCDFGQWCETSLSLLENTLRLWVAHTPSTSPTLASTLMHMIEHTHLAKGFFDEVLRARKKRHLSGWGEKEAFLKQFTQFCYHVSMAYADRVLLSQLDFAQRMQPVLPQESYLINPQMLQAWYVAWRPDLQACFSNMHHVPQVPLPLSFSESLWYGLRAFLMLPLIIQQHLNPQADHALREQNMLVLLKQGLVSTENLITDAASLRLPQRLYHDLPHLVVLARQLYGGIFALMSNIHALGTQDLVDFKIVLNQILFVIDHLEERLGLNAKVSDALHGVTDELYRGLIATQDVSMDLKQARMRQGHSQHLRVNWEQQRMLDDERRHQRVVRLQRLSYTPRVWIWGFLKAYYRQQILQHVFAPTTLVHLEAEYHRKQRELLLDHIDHHLLYTHIPDFSWEHLVPPPSIAIIIQKKLHVFHQQKQAHYERVDQYIQASEAFFLLFSYTISPSLEMHQQYILQTRLKTVAQNERIDIRYRVHDLGALARAAPEPVPEELLAPLSWLQWSIQVVLNLCYQVVIHVMWALTCARDVGYTSAVWMSQVVEAAPAMFETGCEELEDLGMQILEAVDVVCEYVLGMM